MSWLARSPRFLVVVGASAAILVVAVVVVVVAQGMAGGSDPADRGSAACGGDIADRSSATTVAMTRPPAGHASTREGRSATDKPIDDATLTLIRHHLGQIDEIKKRLLVMGVKGQGASVSRSDIVEHIDFPRNPAGARYQINPIGKPPVCIFEGRQFSLD